MATKIKITTKFHHKPDWDAKLAAHIELFYYDEKRKIVYTPYCPIARGLGMTMDFKYEKMLELFRWRTGYYFASHMTRQGNYLGENLLQALQLLRLKGLASDIREFDPSKIDEDSYLLKTE